MITEITTITIDPTRAATSEMAVAEAAPLFREARNCHGIALERILETPGEYRLRVVWASVDDHLVGFRNSDAFRKWRALAGPFFAQPPKVEHAENVAMLF